MMKSYSDQKKEFEKFNCFSIDFYKIVLGECISTVTEREYIPNITRQICFAYQFTGFYMIRGFTERYFLTDCSYILEKHFLRICAHYCFKPALSRIFCVSSFVKVLSPRCEGPSIHLFPTSSLCTFIIYRKKYVS